MSGEPPYPPEDGEELPPGATFSNDPHDDPTQEAVHDPENKHGGAKVYHSEIKPELREIAMKQMLEAVKGNGIKADDVEMTKFEGETLEFLAQTELKLMNKNIIKHQMGKVTGPKLLASTEMFQEEADKEMNKIAHSYDVIERMRDAILNREDKGLALSNIKVKLPFLHKDFVVHQPCRPCGAKGQLVCQRCAGKGQESCPRCHGRGSETCPTCAGRQYIQGPNNQNQQCMHCNGTGRTPCSVCHEARQITCSVCKGKTTTLCQQCNGHAFNSVICMAQIDPVCHYGFQRDEIPKQALDKLDLLGSDIQHHADIEVVRRTADMEREHDDIGILYHIKVPMAHVGFELKNLAVPAFLFGIQGQLYDASAFIEKITSPGIKALKRAALGQGDVAKLLGDAGKYRSLRDIILDTSRMKPKKAMEKALRDNPLGLPEETAKKLIIMSQKALQLLNKKPKQIGTIIGFVTAAAIGAAYFVLGREALPPMIPMPNAQLLSDGIGACAAALVGYLVGSTYINISLKKSLTAILAKK